MANSRIAAAFVVALMATCVAGNTLWMPVQVVDCDNRPVEGVNVALWGCVDAAGSSAVASTPAMSSVISKTDRYGYVIGVKTPPLSEGACPGLSADYCFGSAEHACKISVLNADNTTNARYTTETLFDNYPRGVKEYVVTKVPVCLAKSFGVIDKCNDACATDQFCHVVTTVLSPNCCPRKVCSCRM